MHAYVGRNIWIDAVSINQNDDQEKAHQVRAMDRVYRQAELVLIWLGVEAEDSNMAVRGISTYGKAALDAGILSVTKQQNLTWSKITEDPALETMRDGLLRLMKQACDSEGDIDRKEERFPRLAFAKLSYRDYFTRVWVKQEVTLAKKATVLCGDESTELEFFHAAFLFYSILLPWEILEWRAGRATRIPGPFSETELFAADDVWALLQTANTSEATGKSFSGRIKYESKGPEPLYDLLYQSYVRPSFGALCCMDPRDKIWGMAGIASDIDKLGLVVTYDKSVEYVYEHTTRALLRQGRIEILSWCRSRELQAPTWVPDLALPIRPPWSNDDGKPLFRTSGNKLQPEVDESAVVVPGMVRLHGMLVDMVSELGFTWQGDVDVPFDQHEFLAAASYISEFLEKSRYSDEQRKDALWRIQIGDKELPDSNPYYVRGTELSQKQYQSLVSTEMNEEVMASTGSYQNCAKTMHMAKPLLTVDGYVGLGPSEMEDGDVVAILWGGSTPYILRRSTELHYGFIVVGEAYIYGIMDGELVQSVTTDKVFELW
jgi:hypothetical protein